MLCVCISLSLSLFFLILFILVKLIPVEFARFPRCAKSAVCTRLLCVCECEMVTHVIAVQVGFVLDYRCLHGIFAKIFGAHLHLYTFSEFTEFESIRMLIIIC